MDWIIGDLHGTLHTLRRLVERVVAQDRAPHFVFVGDYADRGPFSRELVDYLLEFPFPAEFLRGNHDDVLDYLLNATCYSDLANFIFSRVTPASVCRWWLENGFVSTLDSYGVTRFAGPADGPERFEESPVVESFKTAVPEAHKAFYRTLQLCWGNDTHFVCHGFFRPDLELPLRLNGISPGLHNDILWSRFPGTRSKGITSAIPIWDRTGVFGHTPVEIYGSAEAIRFPRVRLIDTAAWLGKHLTAYCCQTDEFIEQPTARQDLARGKTVSPS